MSEERPIEKLLRKYATKRRDDAGTPELHPATRRMLQGEVARQFPKATPGDTRVSFGQILKSWIPILGWVSVVVVVVGFGAMMMFHKKEGTLASDPNSGAKTFDLAKSDPAKPEADAIFTDRQAGNAAFNQPQPVLAPAPASPAVAQEKLPPSAAAAENRGVASRDIKPTTESDARLALAPKATPKEEAVAPTARAELKNAPAPTTPAPEQYPWPKMQTRGGGFERQADKQASDARRSRTDVATSGAVPPPPGSVTSQTPSPADGRLQSAVAKTAAPAEAREYTNVTPVGGKLTDPQGVLSRFRVEQDGEKLRVVDGDGSTYKAEPVVGNDGYGLEAKASGAESKRTKAYAETAILAKDQAQNYDYRVTGTNRTLNQKVDFSFNFVNTTNALAQTQTNLSTVLADEKTKGSLNVQLLQNAEVLGEATVGTNRLYRIRAMQTLTK